MPGRPLRVLRLCSVFEPPPSALTGRGAGFDPIGGMQDHTAVLTRALAGSGVVQVVLTTRPPTAPRIERVGANTTVVRIGLPMRRLRQLYAAPAALLAPLLARRADLVHAHLGEDLAILPLAVLAAHRRQLPIVITVHCSLAHTLKVCDARTALLGTLGAGIERWGQRRAAATCVLTSRVAERIARDIGPATVHTVPRPINREFFARPGPDPFPEIVGRPRVVFLGRLAHAKGVETLVEAVAVMRSPGVQLVFVGDGPRRTSVERAARQLGIAGRVHVTGFVPHECVPAVLSSADLLVLPSLYEECGTVLVEAMQVGLPCVATRVGGVPEVLGDGQGGLLVAPGDPPALAAAMDDVLSDAALARRLGAGGRRRAVRYDDRRVAAQVHSMYDSLVGTSRAGGPDGAVNSSAEGLLRGVWPA